MTIHLVIRFLDIISEVNISPDLKTTLKCLIYASSIFVMVRPNFPLNSLTVSIQALTTNPSPTLFPLSTWYHNNSMR